MKTFFRLLSVLLLAVVAQGAYAQSYSGNIRFVAGNDGAPLLEHVTKPLTSDSWSSERIATADEIKELAQAFPNIRNHRFITKFEKVQLKQSIRYDGRICKVDSDGNCEDYSCMLGAMNGNTGRTMWPEDVYIIIVYKYH